MTRQIPWLRVFVEGVVIVGSILLAFVSSLEEGVRKFQKADHMAPGKEALTCLRK